LPAMNAADRRIVHKAASDYGIETESVGFGRDRHIVLKPVVEAVEPTEQKPAKKKATKTQASETETKDSPTELK